MAQKLVFMDHDGAIPELVTLMVKAPLTTVAEAIAIEPKIMEKIAEIV